MTSPADAADRNAALLSWFDSSARDLPWRTTTDPYLILVSEVMLQQTQVNRVIPKYEEFTLTWPSVGALAGADTSELLRVWSGLGYNSRALRLRDAASIVDDRGWPTSISGLQQLPGVGPYTAAAVGSIALGLNAPAVDTNLKRVLSRWAGEPLSGAQLSSYAHEIVGCPPGDWNQALMDLGSAMCRPVDPLCGDCPVSNWCLDPSVYDAPRRQDPFEGSNRQLRGLLVRAHLAGEDAAESARALGWSLADVRTAQEALESEGLIEA